MPLITLPAHFDGERICLDEKYDLEPDTKLIVTILPKESPDPEHDAWLHVSGKMLEQAYGEDEPDYSFSCIKEENPTYEAG